jgi:hypothetical protein
MGGGVQLSAKAHLEETMCDEPHHLLAAGNLGAALFAGWGTTGWRRQRTYAPEVSSLSRPNVTR